MIHSFVVTSNFDILQQKCTFYTSQDMQYRESMLIGTTGGHHYVTFSKEITSLCCYLHMNY